MLSGSRVIAEGDTVACMMRFTAVGATPAAANYLTRDMGCEDHLDQDQEALEAAAARGDASAYYARATRDGESPGRWTGHQLAALGLIEGEHVDAEDAQRLLAELRNPKTGEQLGRAPISTAGVTEQFRAWLRNNPEATDEQRRDEFNYLVDQKRTTTGFYDATYSAPKSVSVYHQALVQAGRHEEAAAMVRAHREAVAAANAELGANTYTRVRDADRGGAQVYERVSGVAAIEFDHSTSREQDPHLHTHTAVANRVQAHNGRFYAIDGKAWKPVKAKIAEVYERTLAERIEQTTNARFVLREDGMGREIAGVSAEVLEASSTRSRQVEEHQKEAEQRFKAQNGRAPTQSEKGKLHRRSGLATRRGKSHASPAEQLDQWGQRIDVESVVDAVAEAGEDIDEFGRPDEAATVTVTDERAREQAIRQAVALCQQENATFDPGQVYAKLGKVVASDGRSAEEMRTLLGELQQEALTNPDYELLDLSRPEPVEIGWWREESTGLATWRNPGDRGVLTTRGQLSAERDITKTAQQTRRSGRPLDELGLREAEAELDAAGLSQDQRDAVLHILSSERVSDALAAPAGTGKSFTMGQLADQWERRTRGAVLGIATSQRAAEVLEGDGLRAMNTTQFLQQFESDEEGVPPRQRLSSGDLLVLDEASMSSTNEVARVQRLAQNAGAKLIFTGDPRQLQAVGPSGAFGLVAKENGAAELAEVHRFEQQWERDASLQLRDGQVEAVDEYARQGRIAMGTAEEMRQKAAEAYVADTSQGLSSVLTAATHAEAAQAAARVQGLLQSTGEVPDDAVATLADGNSANPGDLVMATRNDRQVRTEGLAQVTNKERYRVISKTADGSLLVEAEDGAGRAWLPESYTEEHLQLGYAGTEHAAQGISVDTGHTLVAGYVGMTRGKQANHAWITAFSAADEHEPGMQRSARDAFSANATDGQHTAVAAMREEIDAAHSGGELLRIWDHMHQEIATDRYRDMIMHHLGPDQAERIDFDQGSATFYDTMRKAEMAGHDVDALLPQVVNERKFDKVGDLSAVLTTRMEKHISEPETTGWSWSQATPSGAGVLSQQHHEVAELLDERERQLGQQAWSEQPQWAVDALGPVGSTPTEQEEWTRRAGTLAAWREIGGITREDTGLGRAPEQNDWLRRNAWLRAARAVETEPERIEVASAGEHELREWVAQSEREAAWAPQYVAEDLGMARSLAERHANEASLLRHQANAEADEQERERLRSEADELHRRGTVMRHRADALAEVDETRASWLQATESTRARARAAREELAKREAEKPEPEPAPVQDGFWSGKALLPIETPHERAAQQDRMQAQYAEQHSYRDHLQHLHGAEEGERRWQEQQGIYRRTLAEQDYAGARPERADQEQVRPERVTVSEELDEQQTRRQQPQNDGSEQDGTAGEQQREDEQLALFGSSEVSGGEHRQAAADAVQLSEDALDTGEQADRAAEVEHTVGEAQRAAWATQQHLRAQQQRKEREQEEMQQFERQRQQESEQQQERQAEQAM